MKKLLYLLLPLLLGFQAFAQNKANPVVTISYGGVSYSATAGVPKNYYALTSSGKAAMEAAVKSGVWSLTTTDGCVIPAGTKPPKTKPTCSAPPSETAIAYNRTLGVKTFGTGTEYDKPGTVDGVIKEGVLTWTLNDIPIDGDYGIVITYQSNTAVPTANFSINNGSAQGIELTASGGQLRTKTGVLTGLTAPTTILKLTPSGYMATASIQLIREGSTNPGTGGGGGSYNKVLIVANSIGYYPAPRPNWPGVPRGMAATAPEKDFVHLLTAKLQTHNANVQVRTFNDFASETSNAINDATGPVWEGAYWTANLETFNPVAAWQPDLIIMRVGENVGDPTHDFLTHYLALIDKLKSQSPNAKIVLTPSVWGQTAVTNAIATAASQRSYPYANTLASMWTFMNDSSNPYYPWHVYKDSQGNDDEGVNKHPNDAGMQRIADEIWAKIPSNTIVNPGSGTSTAGYGNLFADNSTYVDLPELNRPSSSLQFPRAFVIQGNTRVAINVKLGSVIDYMSFDGGVLSTVNSPIWSNGKDDAGRQLMDAAYTNPNGSVNAYGEGHYEEAGQSTAQMHSPGQGSIGNNPVQGGSIGQNPLYGLTEICYSDGSKLFYKTRPAQWDMVNIYGQMRMKGWIDIDPTNSKVVRRHSRWEMQRTDPYTAFYPTPRQNEWPCWYTTTDWKRVFFRSGRPFTNAPLVEYTYDEGYENIVPPPILASEPVVYMQNRTNPNLYIAIITNGARFSVGGFNSEYITGNAPTSFKANYIGVTPLISLDPDGVYDSDAAFMQGTLAEIDNYVYNHERLRAQWNGRFSYIFNNKSRLGFFLHKAKDQLEKNITDYISVKPLTNTEGQGRDYNISTPEKWIDGRVVKHVYVRMAVTSADGAMWLRWAKPGLVNAGEYYKEFNVTADGQFRTYDIDMTGVANWDGTDITSFVLRKRNNNDVTNDELKIKWISDTDLTSTNP